MPSADGEPENTTPVAVHTEPDEGAGTTDAGVASGERDDSEAPPEKVKTANPEETEIVDEPVGTDPVSSGLASDLDCDPQRFKSAPYEKRLEGVWRTVRRLVKKADPCDQAAVYMKFNDCFLLVNPHQEEADRLAEDARASCTEKQQAEREKAQRAAEADAREARRAELEHRYQEARTKGGDLGQRLGRWRRFVRDFSDGNPHLEEAQEAIAELEDELEKQRGRWGEIEGSREEQARQDAAIQNSPFVRQPGTNLWWYRCVHGDRWNGSRCVPDTSVPLRESRVSWIRARVSCPSGWRLPTVEEYRELMGGECRFRRPDEISCHKRPLEENPFDQMAGLVDAKFYEWAFTKTDMDGYAWAVGIDDEIMYLKGIHEEADFRCVRDTPPP